MLIVYAGNGEVIVCMKDDEDKAVQNYFKNGGRDVNEYDRTAVFGPLVMTSSILI